MKVSPCASDFFATQSDFTKVTLHWTNNSCPAGNHLKFTITDGEQNVLGAYVFAPLGTATQLEISNFYLNTENRVDVTWLENASEFLGQWSFTTLAAPPLSVGTSFMDVGSRYVTISWFANGTSGQINPLGTVYNFEFSLWPDFSSPQIHTVSDAYGTLLSEKVGCLSPGTTYFARMRAINREGIPTAYLVLGSTVTLADSPPPTAYSWADSRWGVSLSPGEITNEDSMVFNASPEETPLASSTIPQKILAANQKMASAGDVRRRPLENGLVEIQSSRACPAHYVEALTQPAQLEYNFTSNAGTVESGAGAVREETLSFYRLNADIGVWNKIPSQVKAGKVMASVRALGTLAVMGQQATSLEDVQTRPNPFRLRDNSGVTFANLAESATLHIYTPSGREVRRLEETDGDGLLVWDGRATSGDTVDPGVYFYTLTSSSDEKRGKIMVLP